MSRGGASEIDDAFGWTIGIILALSAIILFALAITVGWIIAGLCAAAWLLYKRHYYGDAAPSVPTIMRQFAPGSLDLRA